MDEKRASDDPSSTGNRPAKGKYLTFTLFEEDYGIGLLKIREIIGMMPITPVPQTPAHVKGVVNLRGKVIPVMDLRLRFGMVASDYDERTCIIVVEIERESALVPVGIVVDAVSEVLNITAEDIAAPPALGRRVDTSVIRGIAKMDGGIKMLLDIDRVLAGEELEALGEAA